MPSMSVWYVPSLVLLPGAHNVIMSFKLFKSHRAPAGAVSPARRRLYRAGRAATPPRARGRRRASGHVLPPPPLRAPAAAAPTYLLLLPLPWHFGASSRRLPAGAFSSRHHRAALAAHLLVPTAARHGMLDGASFHLVSRRHLP